VPPQSIDDILGPAFGRSLTVRRRPALKTQQQLGCDGQTLARTSHRRQGLGQQRVRFFNLRWRNFERMPNVAMGSQTFQRRRRIAGDMDWRVQILDRFWARVRPFKKMKAAIESRRAFAPQRLADGQAFICPRAPFIAQGLKLL